MVLLFENFHMSDSMLDPSTVKMKNKRPGNPGPQWGQASSFSVDMYTPMPLSTQAVLGTQSVDEKAGTLILFLLLVDAASKLPRRTGVAMGYFLHSAGCGHKGTDRGRAKRPESTGLAQLAAVAPYPTSFCCPGSWEKFGFGGD